MGGQSVVRGSDVPVRQFVFVVGAKERVGNVDGATWIKKQIDKRLEMTATGLDFYHLAENIHKSRRIVFGEENKDGDAWVGRMPHNVKHDGYESLMEGLAEWRKGTRGAKRKEADRLTAYASDRREMIRYPEFITRGWQIGSGPTESQCRLVPERIKGVGMRWDADNAESVMSLQALRQSNQWALYWQYAAAKPT